MPRDWVPAARLAFCLCLSFPLDCETSEGRWPLRHLQGPAKGPTHQRSFPGQHNFRKELQVSEPVPETFFNPILVFFKSRKRRPRGEKGVRTSHSWLAVLDWWLVQVSTDSFRSAKSLTARPNQERATRTKKEGPKKGLEAAQEERGLGLRSPAEERAHTSLEFPAVET